MSTKLETVFGFAILAVVMAAGISILNDTVEREAAKLNRTIEQLPADLAQEILPWK